MNDKITIYYYTAWDGFAWQGCDETTAKSLQGYLEATKTLPRSSADEPPLGGAVPCKIKGEIGVAVYRYLTREKGDLSGRDSLYVALAFVPLDVGCVDFSALLDLPQLTVPQPGGLCPEEIPVGSLGPCTVTDGETPGCWWDGDSAAEKYSVLRGRDGLRKLSGLFFSKYTQLGFLNAVFQSDNGIDDLLSSQTYRVYPEVAGVVSASKALREARKAAGGILDQGHEAVRKMKESLDRLDGWCERQRGYVGLREYHDEKQLELNDDGEKLRRISKYVAEMDGQLSRLPDEDAWRRNGFEEDDKNKAMSCVECLKEISELPVLDHESYKNAVKYSIDAMRRSALVLGAFDGFHRANDAEKKVNECLKENARLKNQVAELEKDVEALKKEKRNRKSIVGEMNPSLRGQVIQEVASPKKRFWMSFGRLDWVLLIVAIIFFAVMAFLLVRVVGVRSGKTETQRPRQTERIHNPGGVSIAVENEKSGQGGHMERIAPASNAVPDMVKSDEARDKGRTSSNAVPDVVKGEEARDKVRTPSNAVPGADKGEKARCKELVVSNAVDHVESCMKTNVVEGGAK